MILENERGKHISEFQTILFASQSFSLKVNLMINTLSVICAYLQSGIKYVEQSNINRLLSVIPTDSQSWLQKYLDQTD